MIAYVGYLVVVYGALLAWKHWPAKRRTVLMEEQYRTRDVREIHSLDDAQRYWIRIRQRA